MFRYRSRTLHKTEFDAQEEEKTNKLKKMIDILKEKLQKYDKDNKETTQNRGIQRTRTTSRPTTTTTEKPRRTSPSPTPKQETMWQSAVNELSEKISRMGSGVHRIDLDQMLDLDMMEMREEEDQKSSNSYLTGTTALPAQDRYDSGEDEKKVPKRQALHPKLTFQRPEFSDIHRPSMNLKELIKRIDVNEGPAKVKALPALIPRYAEEPLYKPTRAPSYHDECPYIPRRPAQECYNAPPSECQATGRPDPACPVTSLCCYDGCINLCWQSPHPPPKLPPLAPPPAAYASVTPQYSYTTTAVPHTYSTPQPPSHVYSSTPQPPPYSVHTPSVPLSTVQPPVPSPTYSTGHPATSKDPLFYQPAPPNFVPKVGPNPIPVSHGDRPLPPSDYHIETNPLLPPKAPSHTASDYVPASSYRSTPHPQPTYAPPIPQYQVKRDNH